MTDNEIHLTDSLSVTNDSRIMNRTLTDNETCDDPICYPTVLVIIHIRETVNETLVWVRDLDRLHKACWFGFRFQTRALKSGQK